MVYIRNARRCVVLGFILAVLSGIMIFGFTQDAGAQGRSSQQREFRSSGYSHGPSYSDSRYHHNRSYPVRGHYVVRFQGATIPYIMAAYDTAITEVSGTARMVRALLLLHLRLVLLYLFCPCITRRSG